MPDPAQLAALAAIHRRGSFDLAAADLHVTPSAVSQRLKALEEAIGTLLIRRGQPCTATPTGLRLIRHHDDIALLDRLLADDLPHLAAGPPTGRMTLRLAVNADSLATFVLPALARTEGFLFDLVIDDQDVSQDWLKRGEVVAAITAHPGPLQGCDTLPLGALRYRATAAPGFCTRWFPQGPTAQALAAAPALTFSDKDRLQDAWAAQIAARIAARIAASDPRTPSPRALPPRKLPPRALPPRALPTHRMAASQAFVDACLCGLGWGMNPEPLVAAHLASGALVDLAPDLPLDVPLHWQFTRLAAPALRSVTAEIRAGAARMLVPLVAA